jgi:D-arabinose 5-phosphate isomerase GutQ
MALQLASEEPEGGPWRAEPLTVVLDALVHLAAERATGERGVVLAVDGRSSSGKTALAARLQDTGAGSAVVHTDDIAWWHSRFGWADLLIDGVLVPFHRGDL